jgi:hypothetical protein
LSRAYYSASFEEFLRADPDLIVGRLANAAGAVDPSQMDAWRQEIGLLRRSLNPFAKAGHIYFEYSIPRLGKRIDAILVVAHALFVIEFKVGEKYFSRSGLDQVWDYALDLKNFHETSHDEVVVPVLVPTLASPLPLALEESAHKDNLYLPVRATVDQLTDLIRLVADRSGGRHIAAEAWEAGRYSPTPTIIQAALALYANHGVAEISRSDASAINLSTTTDAIANVVTACRRDSSKAVCFVTGVPGAGKTLVGLNIATKYAEQGALHSVFLSGNGPLVAILREALARDKVSREAARRNKITKKVAASEVNAFVQNVHHFRDEYLLDARAPSDHIAVFDEAQRAWNREKAADFMKRKRNKPDFNQSEPEFLISCLDRHKDWAVVVCLVGGGQEINTGEAGIGEWLHALQRSFPDWQVFISPNLRDEEYGAGALLEKFERNENLRLDPSLHLAVSMRSFRAEHVSSLVKELLDLDTSAATQFLDNIQKRYPIYITRDLALAKRWLRGRARGTERFGLLASSQALRLKPLAIDIRAPTDPIHWFLDGKEDTRSSYYLEDAATEFDVQGLEVDWACVVWDGDFRYHPEGWKHFSFVGDRWQNINKPERRNYLKNAYRVLLTRARQGMVIVVPQGDVGDPTRHPSLYDPTFNYLASVGLPVLCGPNRA